MKNGKVHHGKISGDGRGRLRVVGLNYLLYDKEDCTSRIFTKSSTAQRTRAVDPRHLARTCQKPSILCYLMQLLCMPDFGSSWSPQNAISGDFSSVTVLLTNYNGDCSEIMVSGKNGSKPLVHRTLERNEPAERLVPSQSYLVLVMRSLSSASLPKYLPVSVP